MMLGQLVGMAMGHIQVIEEALVVVQLQEMSIIMVLLIDELADRLKLWMIYWVAEVEFLEYFRFA